MRPASSRSLPDYSVRVEHCRIALSRIKAARSADGEIEDHHQHWRMIVSTLYLPGTALVRAHQHTLSGDVRAAQEKRPVMPRAVR